MLNTIVPALAFLFFVLGAALLYEAMSASGFTQTAKIIGGASLLSLGLVTLWVDIKNWWKSRIVYKEYHNE